MHTLAVVAQPVYVAIIHLLGRCSTCVCPAFGDCINWGGIAGGLGAAGAGANPKKGPKTDKNKSDKCAGERKAVKVAQAYVDTYQAQLDAIQKEMNELASRLYQALDEMKGLVAKADQEVNHAKKEEIVHEVKTALLLSFQ